MNFLEKTIPEVETIISFHAITGCDTVSYSAGHSKKTSWKKFAEHHMLLRNLGNGDLDDLTMACAGKFIYRVYNVADAESSNEARTTLFSICRSPEALPPTIDAARSHIRRAHFQAMIWKQAHVTNPTLPLPETLGWSRPNDKLVPKLMSLAPVPESCDEMVSCGCKSGCKTMKSSCRNVRLPCTGACKCTSTKDVRCQNVAHDNTIETPVQ